MGKLLKMFESPTVLSTDLFTFNKNTGVFSSEISSLPGNVGDHIRLVNKKTDRSVDFERVKTLKTGSGEDMELAGWEYKPLLNFPGVTKLIIFND
jgi:hypothetical protein